jgi:hypothetical protein
MNSISFRFLTSFHNEEYEENCDRNQYDGPSALSYIDGVEMPITSKLRITTPEEDIPSGIWPVYRILVSISFTPSSFR